MVKENIDSKLLDLIAPESIAYWSLLGIEVESAVQDDIKLGLSMRPELGTRLPEIIHGGAIGSLIDAAAGAMTSTLRQEDDETWVGQATIDMNITFLGPAKGHIIAKPTLLRQSRAFSFVQVDVSNEDNKLVAVGRVTYSIIRAR
ncbi:MAG: hypothetical protein CL792_06520 [Chloroflexi bacterium]|nr:hypothetical protein [Chloroflexota bacterium]|tara:strand:+ start:3986 stop:4420 length:435 start_codon:yes stop_codon:yes gene_type:complete